jgi:hypothetical protein
MQKVVTSDDGHKVTTYPMSANFNPLTATSAQLVANGFPAVPNDDYQRQSFAQVWNRIKNKYHYIEPQIRIDKGASTARASACSPKGRKPPATGPERSFIRPPDKH